MSTTVMAQSGGPVAQGRPSDPVAFIAQLALDERIDGTKLQILWDLQKDILAEQRKEHAEKARVDFFGALADAQGQFPVIDHDAKNPHTGSSYARLESIWAKCCPIWTKYGFAVTFEFRSDKGMISGALRLSHKNGHVELFHTPEAPPDSTGSAGRANKTAIQGNQSTMSYLKRGLLGNLGIVTAREDDDGAGGSAPDAVRQRRGQNMPPVGRDEPIVSDISTTNSNVPPRGSMRETAQEIERKRDQKFIQDLALEFAGATTEEQANEISASLTARAKMPGWMQDEIQALEVDTLERIRRQEQETNESDESGR
jgi:ERF superfamily